MRGPEPSNSVAVTQPSVAKGCGPQDCMHGARAWQWQRGPRTWPVPSTHRGDDACSHCRRLPPPQSLQGAQACMAGLKGAAHVARALDQRGDDAAERQQRLVDQPRLLGALVDRARPAPPEPTSLG